MKGKSIFKKEYFIYCIKLAMPFVLHGLASVVFIHCDKIMLNRLQGDTAVGLYSTAFSLVSVLFIIHSSLNTAWVPFYFDLKKENDTTEILIHSKRLMKFFLLISSGFILMAYDVFKILTPNTYWQAMSLFPFFVLSNYFLFLYLFPSNFEVFSEKNIFLSVGTSFTALLNIILNYFLIKAYGYIGAAISTLISNISLFIFHEIIAFTIGKGKYENKIFFYLYSICILLVFIFIARLFKDLFIVRWIIACMIAIYLLLDIKKRRSIF